MLKRVLASLCRSSHQSCSIKKAVLKNNYFEERLQTVGSDSSLPGRVNWCIWINISSNFVEIQIRYMFKVFTNIMIFTYNWFKDVFKIYITVSITSVNTHMLVVKLYSTCYNLREIKSDVLSKQHIGTETIEILTRFFCLNLLELLHGTFQ